MGEKRFSSVSQKTNFFSLWGHEPPGSRSFLVGVALLSGSPGYAPRATPGMPLIRSPSARETALLGCVGRGPVPPPTDAKSSLRPAGWGSSPGWPIGRGHTPLPSAHARADGSSTGVGQAPGRVGAPRSVATPTASLPEMYPGECRLLKPPPRGGTRGDQSLVPHGFRSSVRV